MLNMLIPNIISTHLPVFQGEQDVVVLALGPAMVEFGDEVVVEKVTTPSMTLTDLYVAGIDEVSVKDVEDEVAELFGVKNATELRTALIRAYGTGLPVGVGVTIYTLYTRPVEESA
jgi:hypothetical protein